MTSIAPDLSNSIKVLADAFATQQDSPDGVEIPADDVRRLVETLRLLHVMARNLEIEVRCFRDMDEGRSARAFLEEEATARMAEIMPDQDGNIIFFDFGKGGRS